MGELVRIASADILNNLAIQWPIIFRGGLYFLAGFIPAFMATIASVLEKDLWPSGPRWFLAFGLGSASGVIIIRAFLDGSPQRHADDLERKKTGTTVFFAKPAP